MLWRSRCTHDLYNVEGVGHTMDGKVIPPTKKLATRSMHHFLSPLLSPVWKRLRVVHKRSKYSSQDIRTCIVFKLARFQLSFSSQAFIMIIKTCVYVCFWNCFFFLCFSLLCGSYYTCTRTELIAKYVWPALQIFSEKISIF